MTTYTKVFEQHSLLVSKNSIEDICLSCKGINQLCSGCPVNYLLDSLIKLPLADNAKVGRKTFDVISEEVEKPSFSELIFEKNPVMLAQNSLEEICADCDDIGVFCRSCEIHEAKRTIASLPLVDIPEIRKKVAKKTSGGGCGTSCSTSCGTKKKKK